MQKFKIIVIGPERVGKSLISDYLYDSNLSKPRVYRPTIGTRILEIERSLIVQGKEENVIV